jgi:hypothetical protein
VGRDAAGGDAGRSRRLFRPIVELTFGAAASKPIDEPQTDQSRHRGPRRCPITVVSYSITRQPEGSADGGSSLRPPLEFARRSRLRWLMAVVGRNTAQANKCEYACSVIAMAAGCFTRRSAVIA